MNLNALRLFVAVVQDGSLSKTSTRLNIPIATISRQISELEKSLNIQLFDRYKAGVKPTMTGQKLYENIHLSIDNLVNATQVLFDEQTQIKGLLRISTPPNCLPVLDWIEQFLAKYPQVQIYCTATERILDLTTDGIDVAFRIGNLHGDDFISKKVLDLKSKWVAHPDLLMQFGSPQTVQDLANLPLAGWVRNGETMLRVQMHKQLVELPYVFASNENFSLEYMAKQGKAVCLLADYTAEQLIDQYGLVSVLDDWDSTIFELSMLYAAHRYPSSVVRTFVEFVLGKVQAA